MDIEQIVALYDIRDEDIPDLLSAMAINAYEKHVESRRTEDIDRAVGLAKEESIGRRQMITPP
jgi:hypothetical protein